MHGGAKGSGAPEGKANGRWRHGGKTREALSAMQAMLAWLRMTKKGLEDWE
jgi:hypothetical protein